MQAHHVHKHVNCKGRLPVLRAIPASEATFRNFTRPCAKLLAPSSISIRAKLPENISKSVKIYMTRLYKSTESAYKVRSKTRRMFLIEQYVTCTKGIRHNLRTLGIKLKIIHIHISREQSIIILKENYFGDIEVALCNIALI